MNPVLDDALKAFFGSAAGLVRVEHTVPDLDHLGSPTVCSFNSSKTVVHDLKNQGYKTFRYFAVLPALSMPRWLLPIGDASGTLAGTHVYFPHRWVPRSVKQVFMGMIRMGWHGWPRSRVLIASKERLPVEIMVAAATDENQPRFALSLGRKTAVRKLTAQVMRPDGEILGYVKLPLGGAAAERVRHEAKVLERLWNFPALRPHIPRLLHAGSVQERYLLFQSYLSGELGPTKLNRIHENFLQTLWNVNPTERSGQSLVSEMGPKWDKAVMFLSPKWKSLGDEVLRRATQELENVSLRCGISHGDFAPWNTRVHQGKLLLFDWESTHWAAPTSWDIFHFGLQTAVSLNKGSEKELPGQHKDGAPYLLYLLSSVIQFLEEENWAAIDHRRKLLIKELKRTITIRRVELNAETPTVRSTEGQVVRPSRPISETRGAPRIVTTSWDDGDPRDIQIADLLRSRGLAGTFYIPMSGYLQKPTLTHSDLRTLADSGFEIGAHSMSHNTLTYLYDKELEHEVVSCKQTLEQLIGKEVSMFCYPNGRYNPNVIRKLKAAGYKGARTTQMLSVKPEFLPFEMPTTLQAYPHPSTGYLRDLGRARNIPGLWRFTTELSRVDSWIDLGKKLFHEVLEHGGVWHLYGHSWEIEELGIWGQVQEMLDYVSNRAGITYLTNGQLLSAYQPKAI